MDLKQLYIENCEGFDEYMPDGSCRNGLRMTLGGFQEALRKFSGQIEPLVMPKIAEAFERYLRSESEYPSINWNEQKVEQYRNDRRYRKDIYEELKWQNSFSYAFEFAKKRLFEKIIKETLDSNFTA